MFFKEFKLNASPFELFYSLNPKQGAILLESSLYQKDYGRYSIIVSKPKFIISYNNNQLIKIENGSVEKLSEDTFEYLQKIFNELKLKSEKNANHKFPYFTSGFVGFLSYDFGLRFEKIKDDNPNNDSLPELFFGYYDSALIYDHKKNSWAITSHFPSESDYNDLVQQKSFQLLEIKYDPSIQFASNFTKEEYFAKVEKAKKYIYDGDTYQINLSQQFQSETKLHPLQIYSNLRKINPAPFSALMCIDEKQWIISSSPELFLHLNGRRVVTKPIKGTINRGKTEAEDEELKKVLFESEKDNAELLMIIDLERNDLGRVCKYGSVKVEGLKKIETYSSVHHLVAEITGELDQGKNIFDLIRAAFPGGSITGAPKIRSMQIISELEKCKRSVYTGSIGWIDLNGNAEFNIAIRTMIYDNRKIFLNLGGGIVADSDPLREYEETLHKGDSIFKALKGNQ